MTTCNEIFTMVIWLKNKQGQTVYSCTANEKKIEKIDIKRTDKYIDKQ